MDDLSAILASIFSAGTFNEMLRRPWHSPPSAARSPSTPAS